MLTQPDASLTGRPVLVHLAGVGWDALPGTDRHLAVHLAPSLPVLWVDPPLSVVRGRAWPPVEVTEVDGGVLRASVLAPPFPDRRWMAPVTRALTRRLLRRVLARHGLQPVAVLNASPYAGFEVVPAAPWCRRLYLATDDFVAGAALLGHDAAHLERAERARIAEADEVAAVSAVILDRWGVPGTVLPNGCDPDAYAGVETAPLPPDVSLPGPVAGVVGQLSERLDLALLEAVADSGTSLLLVGPLVGHLDPDRFAALVARRNVTWVGAKPFAELPSYLRVIDVGLTPYVLSDFNRASFPLKTLEYLAAGRAVVSTPLPAVAALGTHWIATADGPADFVEAVRRVAALERTPDVLADRRAFATTHSWSSRAADVLGLLGITPASR